MYRLLYVSHTPFVPDAVGGSELSMNYLLGSLSRRGWQTEAVCTAGSGRRADVYRAPDHELGYPCYRVAADRLYQAIDDRLEGLKPNAVISGVFSISLHLLRHCLSRGVPGFYYATIPERMLNKYGPLFRIPDGIHCLANSQVTAENLRAIQVREVGLIRPMIDLEKYRAGPQRERKYITFVNPVPVKGVAVALKLAESMPDRRFLFVKARWGTYAAGDVAGVGDQLARDIERLSNVTLWETQDDMRRVYAQTDVLLFPSQWEESVGRVIVEAQVNGIPVVASRVGGVPDQLGEGGILVERKDDIQAFANALRLLENSADYATYSERARRNSERPELQAEFQVTRFAEFAAARLG